MKKVTIQKTANCGITEVLYPRRVARSGLYAVISWDEFATDLCRHHGRFCGVTAGECAYSKCPYAKDNVGGI